MPAADGFPPPDSTGGLLGLSQRLPPQNGEAEQALLGALLANNRAFDRVSSFLRPEHFADPIHARLYGEIAQRIESLGYDGFIAYHMDPESIDDSALDAMLATNPTVSSAPWQLSGYGAGVLTQWFAESGIVRAIYTRRQFYERMVELWR